MDLTTQAEAVLWLLLAAALSAIIGYDRERQGVDAGLRTHMLVGIGACLFTLVSREAFPESDSSRIASGIVTGIGFLGAGMIFRRSDRVRGLTTAADVWAVAAMGIAVGAGAWLLAIGATLLIWFVLVILRRVDVHQAKVDARRALDQSAE